MNFARAGGRTADATVLAVEKHVSWFGGSRVTGMVPRKYQLKLLVEPKDAPSFEAGLQTRDEIYLPQAGDPLVVLYDPQDHTRIALDVVASNQRIQHAQLELRRRLDREPQSPLPSG
jgi:hypothetical protein